MWVTFANFCERTHSLPRAGGVLDQPYWTMNRLNLVWSIIDEQRDNEMKKKPK